MTTYGIRIRDEITGAVVFNPTDRLPRSLDSFFTGGVSGSLTDARLGTVPDTQKWKASFPQGLGVSTGSYPSVTIAGTTLTWTYATGSGVNSLIVYGLW